MTGHELRPLLHVSAELKTATESERRHLVAAGAEIEAAMADHIKVAELHGVVRHGVAGVVTRDEAAEQLKALQLPAGTVGNPARVLPVFILVGLASLCVSAGPPHTSEVRPVTATDTRSASSSILAGKSAMQAKDYRAAVEHFQDAATRGAVPESYLPPMIECRLAAGQFGLAESLCAELANANPRNQSLVPYFRGACLYGKGLKAAARSEYAEAAKLGHPGGHDMLAAMNGVN